MSWRDALTLAGLVPDTKRAVFSQAQKGRNEVQRRERQELLNYLLANPELIEGSTVELLKARLIFLMAAAKSSS